MRMPQTRWVMSALSAMSLSSTACAQPAFELLGLMSSANPVSRAFGMSPCGIHVVGIVFVGDPAVSRAFHWIRGTGLTVLPTVSIDAQFEVAYDVSSNAAMIVGQSNQYAVAWVNGAPTTLPSIPGASREDGSAAAVSDDGRVIVGSLSPAHLQPRVAVRWRDLAPESLAALPGEATPLWATAIAEDGKAASISGVGSNAGYRAIQIATGRVQDLGDLPGANRGVEQEAMDISSDGRRIVGRASPARGGGGGAFVWSSPTGMVGLGTLHPPTGLSIAWAVSGDGRVVGGLTGTEQPYRYRAFLWDAVRGMRSVDGELDSIGVDRQGWKTNEVRRISQDGVRLVGAAYPPKGAGMQAVVATLPPWCWADCTGDDVVDFSDLLCFLNRFERAQDPRANPIDFFYCDFAADDTIDFNDFLAFLNLYNQGCPK